MTRPPTMTTFRLGDCFPITDLGPSFAMLGTGTAWGIPAPVWVAGTVIGCLII
ncbi:MAG: hypothetical protein KDA60_00600 [Planctomycetales bacterium]|nr:hypothetical protein [Planctomycetales bacterium]